MRNILVTSALPYANGHLHLGHMLGYIQSDIWVRFQKMRGHECYYVCGSDTHGTPIMLKAQREGIKPERLVEEMAKSHIADFMDFEVEFDNYHSTHHPINQEFVEDIYLRLKENNLIAEKEIEQAFDPKAEMFLPDRFVTGTCPKCGAEDQYGDSCEVCSATYAPTDLINPVSVISGEAPIRKKSLHYFFKLSELETDLKQWIQSNNRLQPEVVNKLKEWFDSGLHDWDISRDAPYFGYKVPGTEDKYFYVWLDAPIGYLASFKDLCNGLGLDFDSFWSPHSDYELYHFIGKDIIYFHALFWPAVLKSANYRTPTSVFANGFLTINGKKMSKSRGTFISARTYLNHLNPEYLRYYFASKLTSHIDDIDVNLEDLCLKVNSDLVGKVVNIASRCAGFIHKKFEGQLSSHCMDDTLLNEFISAEEEIADLYEKREFAHAMRHIMQLADKANQFIDHHKPWQLAKQAGTEEQVQEICSLGINLFKILVTYLKPVLPVLADKSEVFLNMHQLNWKSVHETLLSHTINKFKPLMVRIEPEKVEAILEDTKKEHAKEAKRATTKKGTPSKSKKDNAKADTKQTSCTDIAPEISFDDFMKVDLRVVKIVDASHVENADKLLCLKLDLGNGVTKQVFAGIKSQYDPQALIGRSTVMVANLAPRKMRFGISEGMVVAAGDGDGPYILSPDEGAVAGMRVK
jgi:methionyl-tRNA synthetase